MGNIAIIPARSGSKGLKDKNIRLLKGKPLLVYTLEAACESGLFDCVHVSTDSSEYAEIARKHGADVPFLRDGIYAGDTADTWDAARFVMEEYKKRGQNFETVALLQPTSPLRDAGDIKKAYKIFESSQADSVISVCPAEHAPRLINHLGEHNSLNGFFDFTTDVRRQAMGDYYRINGAVYIQKTSLLMQKGNLYGEKSFAYVMEKSHSIDIDDAYDFCMAEAVMGHDFTFS